MSQYKFVAYLILFNQQCEISVTAPNFVTFHANGFTFKHRITFCMKWMDGLPGYVSPWWWGRCILHYADASQCTSIQHQQENKTPAPLHNLACIIHTQNNQFGRLDDVPVYLLCLPKLNMLNMRNIQQFMYENCFSAIIYQKATAAVHD